jgi:hypothetical protein
LYCLAVTLVLVGVKLLVATQVHASGLFADDYDYLNKSIYFTRGDFALETYPYNDLAAGLIYPLLISPWMLLSSPAARLFLVFALNILLSGVVVVLAALAIQRATRARLLLAPVCIGTLGSLFHISYYALTENLLFALMAVVLWLAADFGRTCSHPGRLAALLLSVALLPLTRTPGFAMALGLLVLVALHLRELGPRRCATLGLLIATSAILPYVVYLQLVGGSRESSYVSVLLRFVGSPDKWVYGFTFTTGQLLYIFASTAFWALPVVAVSVGRCLRCPRPPRVDGVIERNRFFLFLASSSLFFVGFCVVHMLLKYDLQPEHRFSFIGRYNDPPVFLVMVGAIGALSIRDRFGRVERIFLQVAVPLAVVWAIYVLAPYKFNPSPYSGLALFGNHKIGVTPVGLAVATALCAVVGLQALASRDLRLPVVLGLTLVFNAVTVAHGTKYTIRRAARAAYSLEAAAWIAENIPARDTIGYDYTVRRERAPGGVKNMLNVYRAMHFATYPRPVIAFRTEADLDGADYLYTLASREPPEGLESVWTNGDYTLYQVNR